jgi:membrane protein
MRKYLTALQRAAASFGSHNDTSYAAAIAYNAIFSIFPLLLLSIAFLGFFFHSPSQRESVVNALFKVLGSSVGKDALRTQVNAVAGGSAALGIVGIIAAAWSATGVFDQIRTSLQIVWNSTKPRPFVQQKLIDFGMLFTVGVLILLSMVATGVLTALEHFGAQILGAELGVGLHVVFAIGYVVVPTAILFCAFSLLYWLVPHAEIRLRDVWFGALVAAIAFEIIQLLFAYYVANFGHYNQSYGALGGVIAFLFFIYLAGGITLFGGEVAKEYIDVLAGVQPEQQPQTKPEGSLKQRAWGMVKGLFVDTTPHHDTSLPYQPGRNEPSRPNAPMVTDKESHNEQAASSQRPPVPVGGGHSDDAAERDGHGDGRR